MLKVPLVNTLGQSMDKPCSGKTIEIETSLTAGEYPIVLTVTDTEGHTATAQQSVLVWQPGQAIIVSGPPSNDSLYPYSNEFTQRLYRLLKPRGYSDDQIHYLNVQAPDIESPLGYPEPERQDYNFFDPKQQLTQAFATAAAQLRPYDQFIFFLHGHATTDLASLGNERLSATSLRDLLATLPANVQQIIILDTCYSGSFIDELAGVPHRVVITSSNDESKTWQVAKTSFEDEFLQSLAQGRNLLEAFEGAREVIVNDPKLFGGQTPWIDDDGDGQFLNDGLLAANIYIGRQRVQQSPPPSIKQVHPRLSLAEYEGTATLWLHTADSESDIYRVRAILINPNYQLSDYLGQDTDFSRIELEMGYSAPQQRYEAVYHGFCREAGDWRIRYQVQNHEGAWSEVAEGVVTVPTACPSATVKMLLNSNRYTTADQIRLDMELNGRASVDLYVAILFPDGYYITIAYPLAFGWRTNTNLSTQGRNHRPQNLPDSGHPTTQRYSNRVISSLWSISPSRQPTTGRFQ